MNNETSSQELERLLNEWTALRDIAIDARGRYGKMSDEYKNADTRAKSVYAVYSRKFNEHEQRIVNPLYDSQRRYNEPLDRQYNLNTKYGRRKARDQAKYNYDNGTPEYRESIDEIGCVTWGIILFFCAVVFMLIWAVSGPEAAIRWLK